MGSGGTAAFVIVSILTFGCAVTALIFALKHRQRGPQGPPGQNGQPGKPGQPGQPGQPGKNATGIDSVIFIPPIIGAHLLIPTNSQWKKLQLPQFVPSGYELATGNSSKNLEITMYVGWRASALGGNYQFLCFLAPQATSGGGPDTSNRLGGWSGTAGIQQATTIMQWKCDTDSSPFPPGSTDSYPSNYANFGTAKDTIPTAQLFLWYQGNWTSYPGNTSIWADVHFTLSQPLSVKKSN